MFFVLFLSQEKSAKDSEKTTNRLISIFEITDYMINIIVVFCFFIIII